MEIGVATIDVPGRGNVPVFQPAELDAIKKAMTGFYGKEPDQATADAIVAALAEVRIMSIGLRFVLDGKSGVGFSEEEGIVFGSYATVSVAPLGHA